MNAFLILEDGTVFKGTSIGSTREIISEIVFNTSMWGYLEVLTDPSYAGQAVCMTYPLIGNYGGHEKLGHGIGYKYAHDYPNHYVHQQYLPTEIQGEHFYELSEMGYEKTLKEYQNKIKSQS